MLFQRCRLVDTRSRRGTTSNQPWNNVVYFNVGIYNVELRLINVVYFNVDMNNVRQRRNNVVIFVDNLVFVDNLIFVDNVDNLEQRWINVVYFNVDMNNVRQRRNNVVIFHVEFHNVGQRQNVAKTTISKNSKF